MKTTLTTTIILLFTQFCFAQDFWMQLDVPENFVGRSMDANSLGWLFVGTNDGVYRSTDNGLTLSKIGLENVVLGLTIDLQDNIFAGSGPIYLSANNGNQWSVLYTPSDVNVIYTKEGVIIYGFWGGIYKSTDNGQSWTPAMEMSYAKEVSSIVENNDGLLFSGITAWSIPGGGVYRSYDNGDTWEQSGLPDKYIRSLAVNSQGDIFAGSIGDHYQYYGGLYKSTDNGETWIELRNDVLVTSIAITPDDHIYFGSNEYGDKAGVFFSKDNGETWERIISGLIGFSNQKIEGLSLAPDGYLYAYGNHLHRSVEPVFTPNYIDNSVKSEVKIFPNPFTDFLYVDLPNNQDLSGYFLVRIFDSTGKLVFIQSINHNQSRTINLTSLPSGLYYISIGVNGMQYSEPIIKVFR